MNKTYLLACLTLILFSQTARAVWAKHEVVTPENLEAHQDRTPAIERLANGTIQITAPAGRDPHKAFYLILCRERLPAEQLEFRMQLSSWKQYLSMRERLKNMENAPPLPGNLFENMAKIETIRPLPAGESVVLEVKEALRAYVVWDHSFIYERGGMVMDGGLWLTFDVPAFVQALPGPE